MSFCDNVPPFILLMFQSQKTGEMENVVEEATSERDIKVQCGDIKTGRISVKLLPLLDLISQAYFQ